MTWQTSTSQTVGPASIADVQAYVLASPARTESAVDAFYRASQELLLVGNPNFLTANPGMGPLLLVGLVSITENYFRDIFTQVIQWCPVARAASADQSVKLGSVVWHGAQAAERGAFEHLSFASSEQITTSCNKFLAHKLARNPIIDEFDKVCELRHGIVHSSGVLAGKNAIRLQLPVSTATLRVVVGFAELQECAQICTSLVVSINQELFVELSRRWSRVWPFRPGWQASQKNAAFKNIWSAFHSQIDADNSAIPSPMSMVKCRNQVAKHRF